MNYNFCIYCITFIIYGAIEFNSNFNYDEDDENKKKKKKKKCNRFIKGEGVFFLFLA